MHTTLAQPTVNDKTPSSVNYLSAFNSTTPSTGLYLSPTKTDYPIINEVSNGSCYQTNLYSYNQTTFNNNQTTNQTTNSYDQAAINRRKNATRETTNTLKAWLYEHRKNPYPTKGEKIMLAIITKMTLTQVSTWFANARRRLKKENKMTWSPRNKCNSGSGDEDDSSDIEYIGNENDNNELTTVINETSDDKRSKNKDSTLKDEEMVNGHTDDPLLNRQNINKCDDSDSNTSSNLKQQQNSPTNFDNYGKDSVNYTADSNYTSNLENHERFLPYHREQLQFPYSTNRNSHHPQYHIAYSTSIPQLPSVPNLAYSQSHQLNDSTSIYNQINSHYNVHTQQNHQTTQNPANLPTQQIASSLQPLPPPPQQQQQQQQTVANSLIRPTTSIVNHQTIVQDSSIQHPVYHHVPNLNTHHNSSYSLLQNTYPTDYMLAHHTHQLQQINNQTNNQQLTQNSLYNYQTPTTNSLTQLTQVQSNNSRVGIVDNYTSPLNKTILNETKSDENNNLDNNSSILENTRKIWSLAQTATDSHTINSLQQQTNVILNQENTSPSSNSTATSNLIDTSAATYIDPTSSTTLNNNEQQSNNLISTTANSQLVKGHSPNSTSLHVSSYMNSQLNNHLINNTTNSPSSLDSTAMLNTNNQLGNYSNNNLHHQHQNYSTLDCGQIGQHSNTFLGKVFFDYISTGTTGPLEHERNNWTRIGLL